MSKNASQSKIAAMVTLKSPGTMTLGGRRRIAAWLRKTAADLTNLGSLYTTKEFRAKYYYK